MTVTIKNKIYSTDDATKIGTMIYIETLNTMYVGVLYLKKNGEYFLYFRDISDGWDNPQTAIFPQSSKPFRNFFRGENGNSVFNDFVETCNGNESQDPIAFIFNRQFVKELHSALFSK